MPTWTFSFDIIKMMYRQNEKPFPLVNWIFFSFLFLPLASQPDGLCRVFSMMVYVSFLIFKTSTACLSSSSPPSTISVSVNKIHFHRFVCPVLYTCSKKNKEFASLNLYHHCLGTLSLTKLWLGHEWNVLILKFNNLNVFGNFINISLMVFINVRNYNRVLP